VTVRVLVFSKIKKNGFMEFSATFNDISVISWRSVLLMQVSDKLYHIMLYTLA